MMSGMGDKNCNTSNCWQSLPFDGLMVAVSSRRAVAQGSQGSGGFLLQIGGLNVSFWFLSFLAADVLCCGHRADNLLL